MHDDDEVMVQTNREQFGHMRLSGPWTKTWKWLPQSINDYHNLSM